ncbi:MAG: hypothetical protein CMH22_06240 [Methylophaga sp.]|nr:hypothetical protein [Methylophaga sp.]|tara:strand:+ start:38659 stop:38859 length:201 start_codon:yes stop_codon:yes gene_type:complete
MKDSDIKAVENFYEGLILSFRTELKDFIICRNFSSSVSEHLKTGEDILEMYDKHFEIEVKRNGKIR